MKTIGYTRIRGYLVGPEGYQNLQYRLNIPVEILTALKIKRKIPGEKIRFKVMLDGNKIIYELVKD